MSNIWRRNLNSCPSHYESPSLTTRPGFAGFTGCYKHKLSKCFACINQLYKFRVLSKVRPHTHTKSSKIFSSKTPFSSSSSSTQIDVTLILYSARQKETILRIVTTLGSNHHILSLSFSFSVSIFPSLSHYIFFLSHPLLSFSHSLFVSKSFSRSLCVPIILLRVVFSKSCLFLL